MIRLLVTAFIGIIAMTVLAGMMVARAPDGDSNGPAPSRSQASERETFALDRTVLRRDGSGQFSLVAQVNGQDVRFLVDTGADVVALTLDEAQSLGLDVDMANFEPITRTASGVGYGAAVEIERFELGGEEVRNVEAVVIDGLEVNLLGQSVLGQLGKVELQGDRMVIHHR